MEFIQYDNSSFQFETCRDAYVQWLHLLKTACEGRSEKTAHIFRTQIYALLRFTSFIRDAGYDEMATAKTNILSLTAQLANVERDLIAAKASKETLQRKHNEGIAKSSGHFEAFQALKMELSESQERYRALVQAQGPGVQNGFAVKSGLVESA
jgi:hypothetical protein